MEVEEFGLVYALEGGVFGAVAGAFEADGDGFKPAVDLVGGGVEEEGVASGATGGFEDVEGAEGVDVEVGGGVVDGGGDGYLGGEVVDFGGVANGVTDGGGVADVAFDDLKAAAGGERLEPVDVAGDAGAGEIVEDADVGVGLREEALGEVRADEARAAGDEDDLCAAVSSGADRVLCVHRPTSSRTPRVTFSSGVRNEGEAGYAVRP